MNPWENGWDDGSEYLTPSQLITPTGSTPDSYKTIFSLFSDIASAGDLRQKVLDPLVENGIILSFQAQRIVDVLYDHSLLPPSVESNFIKFLALLALEIDLPGSADYVTLQFKLKTTLPDLPLLVVDILLNPPEVVESTRPDFVDPLSAQLASSSIEDSWTTPPPNADVEDPLLADHSAIQKDPSDDTPIDNNAINSYINDIKDKFKPLANILDSVKIKEVPEKEGLLFKHINYIITHNIHLGLHGPAGPKKVIRRYSDFVWLLEYLLKKYPFRVIPGLPPKKFSGSSPDSQFLQRRRRGLHRFLNQLIKHPVLREEPVVVTFLSVPTDLTTWKKQARIDYSLEFKGQKILTNFINSIWPTIGEEFLTNWKNCESNITKLIEVWTKTVVLVERYEKRQQQIAFENEKFTELLNKFTELDEFIYPHKDESKILSNNNKDDINSINDSMGSVSQFFNKTSQVLIDESYTINTTILEKFKNYLDYLYSLQELFERSKRLSVNTIRQLQTRIEENEQKYAKLNAEDVDIKGSELIKLRQVIINDKQEIFQQLNKDWLIKNCCFEEFIMFQETQFLISEVWVDWCKGRYKFQQQFTSLYDNLNNQVSNDMPLGR